MVSLTPRFTLLVVMCNTMAVSLLPTSADAAVIPAARSTPAKSNHVQNPIIPLPIHATVKSAAAHKSKVKTTSMESNHESKSRKSKHHKARTTGQFNIKPILRLASVAFGKTKRYANQDDAYVAVDLDPLIVVEQGHENQQSFAIGSNSASMAKRHHGHGDKHDHIHTHHNRHHHGNHDKITINGKNDHVHIHRRDEGDVSGTIDVMSNSSAGAPKRLASLAMDCSSSPCIMDASETNSTQLILRRWETSIATSRTSPAEIPVRLMTVGFDREEATSVKRCVTYNPTAPNPQPLTAEPCSNSTGDGSSQMFAFNTDNGTVKPMWQNGQDDGMGDSFDNSTNGNAPAQMAGVASANLGARDGPSNTNVTLVFVPADPVVNAKDAEEDASATVTSTVVMTVTSTVMNTGTVSTSAVASTESLAAADATLTSTSTESSLTSISASSTSASASSVVLTSVSPTASEAGVLAVEVVGSISSSSASATGSVDVQALASSIAASDEVSSTVSPSSSSVAVMDAEPSGTTRLASAPAPTMTPVNTAPYQWAFKANARL